MDKCPKCGSKEVRSGSKRYECMSYEDRCTVHMDGSSGRFNQSPICAQLAAANTTIEQMRGHIEDDRPTKPLEVIIREAHGNPVDACPLCATPRNHLGKLHPKNGVACTRKQLAFLLGYMNSRMGLVEKLSAANATIAVLREGLEAFVDHHERSLWAGEHCPYCDKIRDCEQEAIDQHNERCILPIALKLLSSPNLGAELLETQRKLIEAASIFCNRVERGETYGITIYQLFCQILDRKPYWEWTGNEAKQTREKREGEDAK